MSEQRRIRCPVCGAEMNRHAEKVDYSWTPEEPAAADAAFEGVLVEFHTCPACGYVEERAAS
jgi:C4-type Zn-finger protein